MMSNLIHDLDVLYHNGYKFIFIDEVTLMEDFIDSAELLSDLYIPMGMRIVLSGTESLGFWFARDNELYDRVRMIHTTFIPFREYNRLLGIESVDEYICYGGMLRQGEISFDDEDALADDSAFRDDESARRYIDMYGTVTSWGAQFGPNSVRGRMYLQGATGTSTTIQPYPYESIYGPATYTARFTHLFDVSGYPGLGVYNAFFWADLYIANMGWACLPVHSNLWVSWDDYAARSNISAQDESVFSSEYVAATGDTGKTGYIKSEDLNGPLFSTIDEMVQFYREHDSRQIPLYDNNIETVIDTYTILCGIE